MKLNRRELLRRAGLGAAAIVLTQERLRAQTAPAAGGRKPNVLFLFTDDQREDTVAALGNPHIKTPNLDKLVREGFVFRNAYCMGGFSGAVCLPSRMMMLRGRSWFAVRNLPEGFPNFPKSMNEAGYETYHLGKRGNTDTAVQAQFQHNNYLSNEGQDRTSGFPGKPVADDAIAFLRKRDKSKPFFMYLAFGNPHDPRVADKKYLDLYDRSTIPLPSNFLPFHPFDNGEMVIRDEKLAGWPRTEDEIRRHLHEYYAVITGMDEQIGRVLDSLRELGEYDNTILVFSSDQGIAIGSHGLMGKQNLYEPSMGVPLVFAGPGIRKGLSSDAFAYLFDVFPTICELAGAPVPAGLDGKSLAGLIRGQGETVRDTVFLAYRDVQRAVRRGNWKLIRYPKVNRTQLFHLGEDPHETRDLAGEPAHAEKVKELLAVMAEQQKLFGDTAPLTVDSPAKAEVDLEFFRRPASAAAKAAKRNKKKATSGG